MVDAQEIKRRRVALGLTLQEAADRAGFSGRQRWSGIERGERSNLRADTLLAVARALGCSIEDLLAKPPGKAKGKGK